MKKQTPAATTDPVRFVWREGVARERNPCEGVCVKEGCMRKEDDLQPVRDGGETGCNRRSPCHHRQSLPSWHLSNRPLSCQGSQLSRPSVSGASGSYTAQINALLDFSVALWAVPDTWVRLRGPGQSAPSGAAPPPSPPAQQLSWAPAQALHPAEDTPGPAVRW